MCCAGVRTHSYALQILHKIEDYTLNKFSPHRGLWIKSLLKNSLHALRKQINAISKIARSELMINNVLFFFHENLLDAY